VKRQREKILEICSKYVFTSKNLPGITKSYKEFRKLGQLKMLACVG
jgi:hypothetical protein